MSAKRQHYYVIQQLLLVVLLHRVSCTKHTLSAVCVTGHFGVDNWTLPLVCNFPLCGKGPGVLTSLGLDCREIEVNERMQELVPDIRGSDKLAAGLLIECRGQSEEALQVRNSADYAFQALPITLALVRLCRMQTGQHCCTQPPLKLAAVMRS